MNRPGSRICLGVSGFLWLLALASFARAQGPAAPSGTLQAFVRSHCVDCHGAVAPKGGLRLDNALTVFSDSATAAVWTKVFDKVRTGAMPPPDATKPDAKASAAFLGTLRDQLHQASLQSQRAQGRVVVRRLNRVEYETTLRDLLGPQVEVKELLPEDSIAAGFDNVSAVLDVSAVHLLRYQQAADTALRTIIPTRPAAERKTVRRTGSEIAEKTVQFQATFVGKSAKVEGETLTLFMRPWGHMPCSSPGSPVEGRYLVRAALRAVQTNGKVLPVLMTCRDLYGRSDDDVRAVRDVPEGKTTVVELEVSLKAREMIVVQGWSLPSARELSDSGVKSIAECKGPGLAVEWIELEGPLDDWPPRGYRRLFGDVPLEPRSVAKLVAEGKPVPPAPARRPDLWWLYDPLTAAPRDPKPAAERLLREFLPVAFRRPVDESLQRYFVNIAHQALDRKLAFSEAMLQAYKAVLCSPHFLYVVEPVAFGQSTTLDPYAVASRLAYFLWSGPPDAALLELAREGTLTRPAILRAQVERMLHDPKSQRFTANFAGQWLDLRLINATSPDPQIFTEYDPFLFWSMPRETERFFERILHEDRSLTEFVQADWSFLNERLAQHYGIAGVSGGELRPVSLPADSHRGGVLTQASILKVTADGTRTSPILRGKWVLERIVGQPPAPPPPGTPAIDPDIRGATTIRQQLDKHRNTPACAACHKHIDPPGFALESFDAIGGFREFYRVPRPLKVGVRSVSLANYPGKRIYQGLDVEKGGTLPDGRAFETIDDYKRLLLSDKDQLARNLAEKLLIYSTGADIQFADREVVEQLVQRSREQKYGFRALLHDVVQSRIFLSK